MVLITKSVLTAFFICKEREIVRRTQSHTYMSVLWRDREKESETTEGRANKQTKLNEKKSTGHHKRKEERTREIAAPRAAAMGEEGSVEAGDQWPWFFFWKNWQPYKRFLWREEEESEKSRGLTEAKKKYLPNPYSHTLQSTKKTKGEAKKGDGPSHSAGCLGLCVGYVREREQVQGKEGRPVSIEWLRRPE